MSNYYKNGFMMANREECIIPVSVNNNHEENPATGVVEVERAISKITFRSKDAVQGGTPANTYEVKIQSQTYEDVEEIGEYIRQRKSVIVIKLLMFGVIRLSHLLIIVPIL